MFNPNSLHTLVASYDGSTSVFLYSALNPTDDMEEEGYWDAAGGKDGDYVIVRGFGHVSSIYRLSGGSAQFVQSIRADMIGSIAPALAILAHASDGQPTVTWDTLEGKPAVIAAGEDQETARAAIGAGTSNLAIGTTAETAMAGNTPIPPATTPSDITSAMANKPAIAALVSPDEDYADLTAATTAIKAIIDALKA